jgi:DNA helicase II / ATP-dependent DNA helicase PcrA
VAWIRIGSPSTFQVSVACYAQALIDHYRCDFAHVQARFYEFITATAGARLLEGDGEERPALEYVLVDEYQDTNPIQERIYLALTARAPHNLTVVGDDDQALYRFRGGTVAGMVNFDKACPHVFEVAPHQIQLDKNYRSHEQVVEFINDYITSFPEMNAPGVRAPNKKPIMAESEISKTSPTYYAVAWINRTRAAALPEALVGFIKDHLLKDGVISDLSQCVLLMRSTRDSPRNAGPFLEAFERHEIPVYNPRSKSFMESEEVQCLLAALIHVIDLDFAWGDNTLRDFTEVVQAWVETLIRIHNEPAIETQPLYDYIIKSNEELPKLCAKERGSFLNLSLLEIIYRIISREPFVTWRQDPVRNLRLSKVTRLFESYHSLNLDGLRANDKGTALAPGFLNRFYYMFVSYLE